MSVHTRRAAVVFAVLLAFMIWAMGMRVGEIITSGHPTRAILAWVTVDAFGRLAVIAVASAGVWLISYGLHRLLRRTPTRV
jgi:Na+-transporting methylmalonyl-CoA/oxaloacetate decarboxylase gamma subunit